MSTKSSASFSFGKLCMGILFIITSLIAFSDPASDLVAVIYVFSLMAIFKGIMGFIDSKKTGLTIIVSILDIVIGLFLFFNVIEGITALPYVFAIWFIIDSIALVVSALASEVSSGFIILSVIIGIIGAVIGISLFFNPISSVLTFSYLIGVYFMIWGITYFIDAF